ncbi:MAG: hypothetical protein QME69_07125 [Candidatus Saccharicenans sp.]|nr:hypothetical protein [Candidatus Saccharicenans sp.]
MKRFLAAGFSLLFLFFFFSDCSRQSEKTSEITEPATSVSGPAMEAYDSLYQSLLAELKDSDYLKALEKAEAIRDKVWEEAPLILANVRLVKGQNNTYGVYEPEEDNVYSDGETIYLYLEPAGYKITKNEDGSYQFRFLADFQLVAEDGEILGGQERFADLPFKSWHPNKEVALTFNYNFSGFTAGNYKIITTVHDANSDKRASTETWIAIE